MREGVNKSVGASDAWSGHSLRRASRTLRSKRLKNRRKWGGQQRTHGKSVQGNSSIEMVEDVLNPVHIRT